MAIEEIVREMHEAKEQEQLPTVERKVNPLGKPNKRFLGRTINSMLTHNKRENDRKRANCRRKLKELDERAQRRARNDYFSGKKKKYKRKNESSESENSRVIYSSSSSDDNERSKKKKRKKKQKKKKHKKHSCSRTKSGSSTRSFRNGGESDAQDASHLAEDEHHLAQDAHHLDNVNSSAIAYTSLDHYEQANLQQYTAAVTAAYNQMGHIYSTMFRAATAGYPTEIVKTVPDRRKNDSSNSSVLSISLSDESLPSTSSSLPSLEAYENGILTIKVSSDESQGEQKKIPKHRKHDIYDLAAEDSDMEMVLSSNKHSESTLRRNEEPLPISVDSDSSATNEADSDHSVDSVTCLTDSAEESIKLDGAGEIQAKCTIDTGVLEVDLTEE